MKHQEYRNRITCLEHVINRLPVYPVSYSIGDNDMCETKSLPISVKVAANHILDNIESCDIMDNEEFGKYHDIFKISDKVEEYFIEFYIDDIDNISIPNI